MIRTHIDLKYEYYLDYFQGQPVKIMRDVKTGEVLFDAASVAPILGFESAEAMLGNDAVLDAINQQITKTGASPIRRL